MRALLIEANGSSPSRLQAAIANAGWRPTLASSVDAALGEVSNQLYPLVVMQLGVAGPLDAADFASRLRAQPGSEETFLLVAQEELPRETEVLLSAGVDDLVDLTGSDDLLRMRFALIRARLSRLHKQTAELERVNEVLRDRTLALEDAMQARTRLYTSMNHELRTPISAIMLYQELLLTDALGELTAEQRDALERSHHASRHLLELVCDILDLSKLEAGRLVLHPGEVELRSLIDDLLGTMLPLTRQYGSQVVTEIPATLSPIRTDPQRVRQILLNLISNAAKFGRGRPITVRVVPTGADRLIIEVKDEGIGIALGDRERIFEDFVQVGDPPETGTGLGLSISRRLALLLGGRLTVESVLDTGSTFRLQLPVVFPLHDVAAPQNVAN